MYFMNDNYMFVERYTVCCEFIDLQRVYKIINVQQINESASFIFEQAAIFKNIKTFYIIALSGKSYREICCFRPNCSF